MAASKLPAMGLRISVITPSFNQCQFLQLTAASVLGQQGDFDLQWIVIDGGSSDGTVEFLKSIGDPRVVWISEPDQGQADAINKGLTRAEGQIIGWLNSDDIYFRGALAAIVEAFEKNPQAAWVVGQCDIIDARGVEIRGGVTRYKNRSLRRYSYRRLLRENFISQPAVFWRREAGEGVGVLDQTLHHAMDYDFWLRLGKLGDPILLEQVLARFRIHSGSKTGQLIRERFDEDFLVARRHCGDDRWSRWIHQLNAEKIVWAYRVMRMVDRTKIMTPTLTLPRGIGGGDKMGSQADS